ncbi:hypothetical protein BKA62DRAFT_151019 [Auriculariales sp. MPI-PUGE-AT-0066]|nr:hypothetical protein BKA62DRAFT_151019 [Auriculariales sp. MPI-PUGE-AT-0066]
MAGRLDLESLLWETREILRDLSKVSRAQSAEIERLGGCPWDGAHELQERADGAFAGIEEALNQIQVIGNLNYNFEEDAASEASSSYAQRHASIAQWAAQSMALRSDFNGEDTFPLGDNHTEGTADFALSEDNEVEVEYVGDRLGDASLASASSSFWKADNFAWADESLRGDNEDDDEEEYNTSGSILNVPELFNDSGRFDSASDSGESFVSADMLAHSGVDSDAAETVCSEREELLLAQPTTSEAVSHRVIRGRTVSFNVNMNDEVDEEEVDAELPIKPSTSTYPSRLLYRKSMPHMRRLVGAQPIINRLVALQE